MTGGALLAAIADQLPALRALAIGVRSRVDGLRGAGGGWLAARSARENGVLAVLAAIVLLSGASRYVWLPLQAARATAAADLARFDRFAARFAAEGPAVARIAAARRGTFAGIVAARAARAGLPVARIDPQGSAVTVGFENVEFDALVDWLAALDRDVGVSAVELKLDRREAGTVAAQVTLRER